jgi:arylsulfatase A-like enzyme
MPDHQAANWAVDQLSKQHEKPFFLMVGFLRPHNPWYVPEKWWDLYDREKIQLPPYKKDDLDDIPKAGLRNIKEEMPRTDWAIETDQWRDIVHSYLASITFVDHQIGKVIHALEESDYSDNTIIVLWSDHGYQMGEKNSFQKASLWERSTHVPLLFAGYGVPEGQSSDRVVSLLDIYPTLVEMSGLPGNSKNEGRSLVPLMKNPSAEWPYPSITGYGKDCYAIQNERYRYIQYDDGTEELYDQQNDPNEWTNLAGSRDLAHIKADLARHIPETNNVAR